MSDLSLAVTFMGTLCSVAFLTGMRLSRSRCSRSSRRIQVTAFLLMLGYLAFLWNRPVLTRLFPTSSLIIVANWLPLWGSFFVGVYVTAENVHTGRRKSIGGTTLALCMYSAMAPLLGQSPDCPMAPTSRKDLQYQTTPYTCSAACAASLLRMHGIDATEHEMAKLCLTRRGTHWMGLYRGLKLKTQGTVWNVVAEAFDPDCQWDLHAVPCVLSISIDTSGFPEGVDHGFQPNCGHSVICLGRAGEHSLTVFDPSPDYGIETWDDRVLKCIDGGVVLKLVPADPDNPEALKVARRLTSTLLNRPLTASL